ncbi:non-ribosomal peptide synthetase [Streptomonospora alba]|uniref:non-ribosomal peptide synthetase n=1 Tax=Streptomonospora alba TaxID=183763 RepID=UPI00069A0881|nr:non-ribosomal peptide synthetase [Streptomonospora alba]
MSDEQQAGTAVPDSTRLSFGQERLWLLQQLDPASTAYNVPLALRFHDGLDPEALDRALGALVQEHPVLRWVFAVDSSGTPVARPVPYFRVPVERRSTGPGEDDWRAHADELAAEPFDLTAGPPVRAMVVECADGSAVLCLVIHHIVFDGRSAQVLTDDLTALYRSRTPPAREATYEDFVAWQRSAASADSVAEHLQYWRRELDGFERLRLPTDRPRAPGLGYAGDHVEFELPAELTAELRAFALQHWSAVSSAVAALFQVLMSIHAGQEDVTIGSVLYGRDDRRFSDVIGFFVNTVVLRTRIERSTSFRELLRQAHGKVMAAHTHQRAPFEQVVAAVQTEREPGRNAIFDVVFVHHGELSAPDENDRITPLPWTVGTTRFDLELATYVRNGVLHGTLTFRSGLFHRSTATRLADRFARLVEQALDQPDQPLSRLDLHCAAESRRREERWRATERPVATRSLGALLEAEVARTPDAVAVVAPDTRLTYGQLDARANQLAHRLIAAGAGAEDIVGVLAERRLDVLTAFLAVVKAGAAYLPLSVDDPVARHRSLLRESGARLLLSDRSRRGSEGCENTATIDFDAATFPTHSPGMDVGADQTAYVMYTSGSTGTPKGVAIAHRQVAELARDSGWTEATRCVLHHSPPTFDAATFEVWVPLLSGGQVVLAPPGALDAAVLERVVGEESVTCTWLTAGLFRVFAEERPQALAGLSEVWTGGDIVPRSAVAAVLDHCPELVVVNGYGPTETTTFATTHRIRELDESTGALPIGTPLDNTRCYVLNHELQPVPDGVIGELFIGGTGVGRGYMHRPDLTASRFLADPFGPPGGRMYRSGDLARWRADGLLEFHGRLDDQVKIRGYRVEPGDIEEALTGLPGVGQAAVVARGTEDTTLAGYVVPAAGATLGEEELRSALAEFLPGHLVPSVFVVLDALPVTANGKIDRRALPEPAAVAVRAPGRAPRTVREEVLCAVFAELLGTAAVGVHDDFFAMGGHSLLAARVASRARTLFGIDLTVRAVFENPTAASLAAGLDHVARVRPPLTVRQRPRRVPLSSAQQRLWFIDQAHGGRTPVYNIPVVLRMRGRLDVAALRAALRDVMGRHESLRTVFPTEEGILRQAVLPLSEVDMDDRWTVTEVTEADLQQAVDAAARRTFDLRVDAPIRACLFQVSPDDHVLLVVIHHIAGDGWSMGPLRRDLATAYQARSSGAEPDWRPLPVQYVDYTLWEQEALGSEDDPRSIAATQARYWRETLEALPVELTLPVDHPRGTAPTGDGDEVAVDLDPELHATLRELAVHHQASLSMVLQAALAALLSKLGAGTDIPLGGLVAGRSDEALTDLIGFFVNTQVLRYDLGGDPTFGDMIKRVRKTNLAAYEHQDLAFDRIVEIVSPPRELSRHPLFQVALTFQSSADGTFVMGDLGVESMSAHVGVAKFDLHFDFTERIGAEGDLLGVRGVLDYDTALFTRSTAERIARGLTGLLRTLAGSPELPLHHAGVLDEADARLLVEWNDTAVDTLPATLTELIERQVARTPHADAVVFDDERLSFTELDARADRLAELLREHGAAPERFVGVALPRSAELVVALVAVLKSGAAYLPIDTEQPADRVALLLDESAPVVAIATKETERSLSASTARVVLDDEGVVEHLAGRAPSADGLPRTAPSPENPAYLVYTSGSTGRPKGVVVQHDAIVNRLEWMQAKFGLTAEDRVLQKTPFEFDVSVWEFFWPLMTGATLVVARPHGHRDPDYLAELIRQQDVTTVHFVPSMLDVFLTASSAAACTGLRRIICSGEALTTPLVERSFRTLPVAVHNLYGPTEAAVDVTSWDCAPNAGTATVPIGSPVWNTRLHVLDRRLRRLPIGVQGELYIAGAQVARGYIGRPDLTAERFIADPDGPPGARMYRTGDLARWTAEGVLEFLGRADDQVKIRGVRIEPDEIATVLTEHEAVRQAVVIGRDDRLVAYVVPHGPSEGAGDGIRAEALIAALRTRLPQYLVPNDFVVLDALPVSSNGKLDRKALPAPVRAPAASGRAPTTPREEILCGLFAEAVGLDRVGVDDNFFDIGGHSLLAARLVGAIKSALNVQLSVNHLFQAPTVRRLGESIDTGGAPAAEDVRLPIRNNGAGSPVFFIHPGIGYSRCYAGFARHLHGFPIYGLQARAIFDANLLAPTLKDMARDYLERIREVQAEGPYRLAGWSFGGNVAHTIAAMLWEAGEEVETLALIDAYPYAGRPRGSNAPKRTPDIAEIRRLHIDGTTLSEVDDERVAELAAVLTHNTGLAERHKPPLFHGDLLFFRATGHPDVAELRPDAWQPFVTGSVRTCDVAAPHHELLRPEPLAKIAGVLADRWAGPCDAENPGKRG